MGIVVPVQEMTVSEIRAIRETAINTAFEVLRAKGVVNTREDCIFRQPVLGDSSSTNFRDLDAVATVAVTGMQEWLIDSGTTTAGDLINVLASGEAVNDDTSIVFYGVANLGGDKDWIAVRFQKGAKILTHWDLQHVHAYNDKVVGFANDMAVFGPNDVIKIDMEGRAGLSATAGEDYRWLPIGVLCEPKTKSLAES